MPSYYTTGDGVQYMTQDGTYLVVGVDSINNFDLVTDRTQADVDRWNELRSKGWVNMSGIERIEWSAGMKGCYSHIDMNRVESVVEVLSARFVEEGYLTTPLTVKTDWNAFSVPTRADMVRYLGNVAVLRGLVPGYFTTPDAPTIEQPFTFEQANDIEQILIDLDEISTALSQSWFYAGEIRSGEV